MNLVKSTGNGMSIVLGSLEERKRALQRKDAGDAYRKHAEFFFPKAPSLSELEDLLLGNKEREPETPEVSAAVREFQQLEKSNNMLDIKGPAIPVQTIGGPTLEKTIELLEKVRSSALAPAEPTPQDLRVAASASAKIQQVQSQIKLNQIANSQIETELIKQKEDEASVLNRSVPSDFQSPKVLEEDLENLQKKRLKEQAIAKYSYQVHLKRYGFTDQQTSFFRIA
ncbi:hypothetical protein [Psychrobacillus vulpis]|uniref:Uncharacterized protein n=1 Tax=Psychrobacillus vulpis TaxID=2325572 RepID=A0A544TTP5_9BACI|nr:hypothetical protein [Psychrobacillus vulpis]TQR20786.1 hypothetical protein FG384_04115 [Psychrobacillus vulpis]